METINVRKITNFLLPKEAPQTHTVATYPHRSAVTEKQCCFFSCRFGLPNMHWKLFSLSDINISSQVLLVFYRHIHLTFRNVVITFPVYRNIKKLYVSSTQCPFRCVREVVKSDCYLRYVCPYGTTRLRLEGVREICYLKIFRKSVKKIQVSLKSDKKKGYFSWRSIYIFVHISLISS
jgi:hypothetical protein